MGGYFFEIHSPFPRDQSPPIRPMCKATQAVSLNFSVVVKCRPVEVLVVEISEEAVASCLSEVAGRSSWPVKHSHPSSGHKSISQQDLSTLHRLD